MPHNADERLKSQLEQKLITHGIRPPCKVTVTVRNGTVTLAGTLQFEHQRRSAVHACRTITGVKSVVDNLQVAASQSPWATHAKEWITARPKTNMGDHTDQQPADQKPAEPKH